MVEGEDVERVVTSRERERLPRFPLPKRRRNRRIMGRKRREVKRVITAERCTLILMLPEEV